jgi:hypothetical protein
VPRAATRTEIARTPPSSRLESRAAAVPACSG